MTDTRWRAVDGRLIGVEMMWLGRGRWYSRSGRGRGYSFFLSSFILQPHIDSIDCYVLLRVRFFRPRLFFRVFFFLLNSID